MLEIVKIILLANSHLKIETESRYCTPKNTKISLREKNIIGIIENPA
jgi:hypothetical protein